ncbi:hypothetical protein, partial [Mesorhizobium japonicum]|uniref:hypothetical protein n=1 Tax=Mesorhizobium japonicum TaxID=2066070 RepID=UPI003B5C4741
LDARITRAHLHSAGVDLSKGMSQTEVATAAQLCEGGLSSMTIGARLGFDNHAIIRALRGRGIVIHRALGR